MRDLLIFAVVFGLLPLVFKRPALGVFLYMWISLMNPHRLTYGPAYDFQFAAISAAVTMVALLLHNRSRRLPINSITIVILTFVTFATFTTFIALLPDVAWREWNRVMKTMLMTLVAMYAITDEEDVKALPWVVGLSLAFYGIKGGLFTIVSGGNNRVMGPDGSYISDNNGLALALVMTLPLVWYLYLQSKKRWLKLSMFGVAILTAIAAVGSYSRGALLAGASMLFFLWLKSRQKLVTGVALLMIVPMVFLLMPEKWFERMHTIDNYQEDSSAMGRINAWKFAMNVAAAHPAGGGFDVFQRDLFLIYAPNPRQYHVAHSIYFQVLGEHGYFGLFLFLLLMVCVWRMASRIIRLCKGQEDLRWASDLAAMIQVSIVGYAVGGAFLSLAYYDMYYYLIASLVVTHKFICDRMKAAQGIARPPPAPVGAQRPALPG